MRINLAKVAVIVLFLTLTLTGTAIAQTTIVGVSRGNSFNYSYNLSWQSTNPAVAVPSEYLELNNTQFIRISIVNVIGSLINIDFTKHFKNGTETTQNGNINVDTQVLELPYSVLLIRAGANPGEKIYPSGGHATLNETATGSYPIGQIETISYVSQQTSDTGNETTEILFDRANGVAVEYNWQSNETSGSYVTTTKETLLLTSWSVPEFTSILLPMIAIIAVTATLMICKKHFKTTQIRSHF